MAYPCSFVFIKSFRVWLLNVYFVEFLIYCVVYIRRSTCDTATLMPCLPLIYTGTLKTVIYALVNEDFRQSLLVRISYIYTDTRCRSMSCPKYTTLLSTSQTRTHARTNAYVNVYSFKHPCNKFHLTQSRPKLTLTKKA